MSNKKMPNNHMNTDSPKALACFWLTGYVGRYEAFNMKCHCKELSQLVDVEDAPTAFDTIYVDSQ